MFSFYTVALTGGIGSGKSTIASYFAEKGATVVDTDKVALQATAPGGSAIEPIRVQFGDEYINDAGAMDRDKMRALVFAQPEKKRDLEGILHPIIREDSEKAAQAGDGNYVVFEIPLLFESGYWQMRANRILAVDCSEDMQISRTMLRSDLSEQQVQAIIATQSSRAQRLAIAHDVLENTQSLENAREKVDELHQTYLQFAAEFAASSR